MWMYITAGIVGLLAVALLSPLVLLIRYDETLTLRLRYGPVRITLLPRSKQSRPKKPKKKKKNDRNESGKWQNMTQKHGVLGAVEQLVTAFGSLSKGALRLIKGARVRRLRGQIRVAGADAADAAVKYGQVCSVLYPFLGRVDTHMKLVRPKLQVYCDYEQTQSLITFEAAVYVSLYHAGFTALYILKEMIVKNLKTKVVRQNERK